MESSASANVTEADSPSLLPQRPKRPNSAVINSLFSIAACSSKIDEIKMCQSELESHKQILQENYMFQRKCQQMAYDLEAERRTHAEELRLINQDINHLEDMMKGIKAAHEQQRTILRQKYAAFQSEIIVTNQICRDCGLIDENLIPFNSIPIPDWLIDKPLPSLLMPTPISAMTASSSNPFFSSQFSSSSAPSSTFRTTFSNYFFPPQQQQASSSASSSVGHLPPRPFGTFLEDISKLKDCQSCKQKIHRNAPICPLCKSKNSSKAKKQRKNL